MGRKERIARAATQTASQARETAARERGRSKRTTSASGASAHRHCSVCWAPIPLIPCNCNSTSNYDGNLTRSIVRFNTNQQRADDMRMVRVLGVLPGFVGFVCLVLLTASLVGIEIDSTRVQATSVPCLDDDAGGCLVGMTGSDFHVPWGFSLIDVEVNIAWDEPEKAWIGVVDAKYAENCPPDSNGLTSCEAEDFEFVAGGPED